MCCTCYYLDPSNLGPTKAPHRPYPHRLLKKYIEYQLYYHPIFYLFIFYSFQFQLSLSLRVSLLSLTCILHFILYYVFHILLSLHYYLFTTYYIAYSRYTIHTSLTILYASYINSLTAFVQYYTAHYFKIHHISSTISFLTFNNYLHSVFITTYYPHSFPFTIHPDPISINSLQFNYQSANQLHLLHFIPYLLYSSIYFFINSYYLHISLTHFTFQSRIQVYIHYFLTLLPIFINLILTLLTLSSIKFHFHSPSNLFSNFSTIHPLTTSIHISSLTLSLALQLIIFYTHSIPLPFNYFITYYLSIIYSFLLTSNNYSHFSF